MSNADPRFDQEVLDDVFVSVGGAESKKGYRLMLVTEPMKKALRKGRNTFGGPYASDARRPVHRCDAAHL